MPDLEEKKMVPIEQGNIEYASFNRRLIASSIDMMLVLVFMLFVINPINGWIYGDDLQNFGAELQSKAESMNGDLELGEALDVASKYGLISKFFLVQLIGVLVFAAFFLYFWIKQYETPGKWLTECKIVDARTLAKPNKWQYFVRFFGYILSSLPFCLGFFAIYWNKKNRAWHDTMAGTVVVIDKHEWKSLSEIKDIILAKIGFPKKG